jgi:OmpA-like transmembrane domain
MRYSAILVTLLAGNAGAAEPDRGFYVGADAAGIDAAAGRGGGIVVATPDLIIRALPDATTVHGTELGWGIQIGYRIHRNLAIELAYTDFGSLILSETYDLSNIFGQPVFHESEIDFAASGPSLSWVGIIPLGDRFEAFIRAGILRADTEARRRNPIAGPTGPNPYELQKVSVDMPIFGLGAAYRIGARWSLRVEYQYIDDFDEGGRLDLDDPVGSIRIRRYGVGVAYRF